MFLNRTDSAPQGDSGLAVYLSALSWSFVRLNAPNIRGGPGNLGDQTLSSAPVGIEHSVDCRSDRAFSPKEARTQIGSGLRSPSCRNAGPRSLRVLSGRGSGGARRGV